MGTSLFALGFVLFLAAYVIWDRTSQLRDGDNIYAKLLPIIIIVIGIGTVVWGWGMMIKKGDSHFLTSIPVTFYYAIGSIPIQLGLALALAHILFQKIRGREFFRIIFFVPYVTPVIATALAFRVIFSRAKHPLAIAS